MNLLEACEYILENPKAVLKRKGSKEPREIMRKRGYHVCIQDLDYMRPVYKGGVPIFMNGNTIRSEWEDTGMNFAQIQALAVANHAAEEAETLRRWEESRLKHRLEKAKAGGQS